MSSQVFPQGSVLVNSSSSPLQCQTTTMRAGFSAPSLPRRCLWEGCTPTCSVLLLLPMAICGVEQVLHHLMRHLCDRYALISENQRHISLPHCLCTTTGFCTGALGHFKYFVILRENVFKYPKWRWVKQLDSQHERMAFRPHTSP